MIPFGDAALRFERPSGTDSAALLEVLRRWPGVIDAIVTEGHCCISFAPGRPPSRLDELAARCATATVPPTAAREHRIGVCYDGPDLAECAAATGLTTDALIELHSRGTYSVAMLGFQPGFAYLAGLDPRIALPRRATPRTRVPARSVAIGGPYTGIYPFASPGGWNLIGTAPDFEAFTTEGARLQSGDRVRFKPL